MGMGRRRRGEVKCGFMIDVGEWILVGIEEEEEEEENLNRKNDEECLCKFVRLKRITCWWFAEV